MKQTMAQPQITEPVITAEVSRLAETGDKAGPWRQWGPYLSERQWGMTKQQFDVIMTRGDDTQ
jgi:hypothetical protein